MKRFSVGVAAILFLSACDQTENAAPAPDVEAEVAQIAGSFEAAMVPVLTACMTNLAGGTEYRETLTAIGARNTPLSSSLTVPYAGTYKAGLFNLSNRMFVSFTFGNSPRGCSISTPSARDGTRFPVMVFGYLQSIGFSVEPQERRGFHTASRGDEKIIVSFIRRSSASNDVSYSANLITPRD